MTTISQVWDPRLGRHRDPYAWELSPLLRAGAPADAHARDVRRAARHAREAQRRAERTR